MSTGSRPTSPDQLWCQYPAARPRHRGYALTLRATTPCVRSNEFASERRRSYVASHGRLHRFCRKCQVTSIASLCYCGKLHTLSLHAMKASWLFVILLLVFVAVFSVQNAEPITVHFLPWSATVSSALVIQLAALLGGLVGLTAGVVSARSARRRREDAERDEAQQAKAAAMEQFPAGPEAVGEPADRVAGAEIRSPGR